MSQDRLHSSSTLSLITTLTNGQAGLAYNVLLDLTGQFRLHDVNEHANFNSLLDDTVIAMTMYGRSKDAQRLQLLCQSMANTGCESSVLFVLLMCARNLDRQRPSRPDSIFGLDKFSTLHKQDYHRPKGVPLAFREPVELIGNTVRRTNHISSRSSPRRLSSPKDRPDCLAHAARLAIKLDAEAALRIRDQSSQPSDRDLQSLLNPPSFQIANRLLSFLKKEHGQFRKRGNPIKLISDALSTTVTISLPLPRELEFLYFILSRCLSDADTDDSPTSAYMKESVARSPLAVTMIQENNVFEEETRRAHTERTRCIHRRRTIVNEHLGPKMVSSDQVSDLIIRSSLCGAVYRDLVSFADAYMSTAERRTLRAVAGFAFKFARTYFQTILSVAGDNKIPISLRVTAVVHAAEQFIADGCIVAEVLATVENTDGSAVAVINVLWDQSVKHSGNETIVQLLYTALTPYFDYIFDWVFQGSSRRDLGGEFFATVLGTSSTASEQLVWSMQIADDSSVNLPPFPKFLTSSQALFLLRAGRGRNLLESFGLNSGALAERHEDFAFEDMNICFDDVKQRFSKLAKRVESFIDNRKQPAGKPQINQLAPDDDSASPAWKKIQKRNRNMDMSKFNDCIHEEDNRFIEDLPESPVCVRCLAFRIPEMSDPEDEPSSDVVENKASLLFSSFSEIDGQPDRSLIDSIMPGTRKKPRFPLGGSIFISELFKPLARIDTVVQREVLRYFIQDLDLYDHIRNLRAHVLLGAGDFANELIDQMNMATRTSEANERFITQRTSASMTFYGSGGPGERTVRDRAYLNQCLRTALNLCSSVTNVHEDLLYLDSETHSEAKRSERRLTGGGGGDQPTLWDKNMQMRYDVEYPLSIVITEEGMRKYSKIFGLFLRILRARKSLRRLFLVSRRKCVSRMKGTSSNSLHSGAILSDPRLAARVLQFCWHATHFVSTFGGFIMEQVLGSCWDDFEAKWNKISSVWEWRDTHLMFLGECLRRCLLSDEHKTVLKVMTDGFEIVANVEKDIVKLTRRDVVEWSVDTSNVMDLLTSATASLKRRCAFLTDVPLLRMCRYM